MDQKTDRLNKFLALQLGFSRRQADEYIAGGRVKINAVTATLGARIDMNDTLLIDNKPITKNQALRYVAFFKPKNFVCSRKKQGDNETIYEILPRDFGPLKPVGRLDKDSSGLLILTNDGDFAHQMTHPKFAKIKKYTIKLNHPLEPLHHQMINDFGVLLEDGGSKLHLEKITETDATRWYVTMHEGRNRQIRRTFMALGYKVVFLERTIFGNYSLGDLKLGEWRDVEKL